MVIGGLTAQKFKVLRGICDGVTAEASEMRGAAWALLWPLSYLKKGEISTSKITVIDSMMGSGKTQAMYQSIRNNPKQSYAIVTPFISTIKSAIKELPDTHEPEYKGGNKLDSLKYLLSHGCNIACTHSLFLNVDDEVWDMVKNGGYILYIDEALNVARPINELIDDPDYHVKAGTAKFLLSRNIISVDSFGRVS